MQVTVTDTTLFHVAATWLGDATQWSRIADLNGLNDPLLVGIVTLSLPLVASPTTFSPTSKS